MAAVVEVQQRASQRREILRYRLLAEAVDLDGMHGETVLAQAFPQPFQVSAVLHEHGDRLLRVAPPFLAENRHHDERADETKEELD